MVYVLARPAEENIHYFPHQDKGTVKKCVVDDHGTHATILKVVLRTLPDVPKVFASFAGSNA